ncbi:hypothetical protein ACE41A_14130 [Bacillus cytotoxicus]|uniref:hypothetical protein n=1 Tax=Bacillus cytotoxicus TaxID=580165 RepID=UPI0035CC8E80
MRETLKQFIELLNLTLHQKKRFSLLFDTEQDIQYFVEEVLSKENDICDVDVLLEKMRRYKMSTCPINLNMFLYIYKKKFIKSYSKVV